MKFLGVLDFSILSVDGLLAPGDCLNNITQMTRMSFRTVLQSFCPSVQLWYCAYEPVMRASSGSKPLSTCNLILFELHC
jgi:hypothetical protein